MESLFANIIYYISNAGRSIYESLGLLGLSNYSKSVVLAGIFFVFIIFVVGFTLGRSRVLLSIISIFLASYMEIYFPFISLVEKMLNNIPAYFVHFGILIISYAVVFTILNRSILKSRFTLKDSALFPIIILSFINVGLFASIFISHLPQPSILGTKNILFGWAIISIITVYFLKGKKDIAKTIPRR